MPSDPAQCLFCKIVKKEVPSEVLQETEDVVIIADIRPSAPIHYLVLPKKHIASIRDIQHEDEALMGHLIHTAKEAADTLGLSGYKLVFNVGKDGGQIIEHIHMHLLGGWQPGGSHDVTGITV